MTDEILPDEEIVEDLIAEEEASADSIQSRLQELERELSASKDRHLRLAAGGPAPRRMARTMAALRRQRAREAAGESHANRERTRRRRGRSSWHRLPAARLSPFLPRRADRAPTPRLKAQNGCRRKPLLIWRPGYLSRSKSPTGPCNPTVGCNRHWSRSSRARSRAPIEQRLRWRLPYPRSWHRRRCVPNRPRRLRPSPRSRSPSRPAQNASVPRSKRRATGVSRRQPIFQGCSALSGRIGPRLPITCKPKLRPWYDPHLWVLNTAH